MQKQKLIVTLFAIKFFSEKGEKFKVELINKTPHKYLNTSAKQIKHKNKILEMINKKVLLASENGLKVICCLGETYEERRQGKTSARNDGVV